MRYYKTRIVLEILSEDAPVPDDMDWQDLGRDCINGDWLWHRVEHEVSKLTPQEVAHELLVRGSDPSFFGLDDNGRLLSEVDAADE